MGPRKTDDAPSVPHESRSYCVKDGSPAFHRRRSNNNISIEELSDDEYAYDGDIEVVRPDQFEEADSDTGGLDSPPILHQDSTYWQTRLVEKLTALNCNSDTNESQDSTDRPPSRKRRSREQVTDPGPDQRAPNFSAELEVVELRDGSDAAPRAKRPRRKSRRSRTSDRIVDKLPSFKADLRDMSKGPMAAMARSESSTTSPSSVDTPAEDAMDVD
jgi:hypothetical protein